MILHDYTRRAANTLEQFLLPRLDTQCLALSCLSNPCRLVMATRCGDMDPAVVLHLQRALNMTPQQVDTLMNKQSGEEVTKNPS